MKKDDSLEEKIRTMSDEQINAQLLNGPEAFQDGIYNLYLEAARERGINIDLIEPGTGLMSGYLTLADPAGFNSDKAYAGRLHYRLLLISAGLGIIVLNSIIHGSLLLIPLLLPALLGIYKSLPSRLYLTPEGLFIRHPLFRRKQILLWSDIREITFNQSNDWDGAFNMLMKYLSFGWIPILISKGEHLFIVTVKTTG